MRISPLGLLTLSLLSFTAPAFAQQAIEGDEDTAPDEGPAAVEDEATPPSDTPPPVAEAPSPPPPSSPPPSSPPVRSTPSTTSSGAAATAPPTHAARETGRVSTGGAAPVAEPVEEEDDGDGRDVDFIWFELEGGVSSVNLIAFQGGDAFGAPGSLFTEVSGTGPFAGLGVGFRVFILSIGARVTYANYQDFDIGNIGGDVTLRLPIPVVEPYVRVGAGYAWQGQGNYANPEMSSTTVYGWSFDSALGIDIYLANWFTIGAGVGLNLLNMSRQSDPTMSCMGATDICPDQPGDAVGYQLRGFLQIGFRF